MQYKHDYSEAYCNRIHKFILYPTNLINTITLTISSMNLSNTNNYMILLPILTIINTSLNMTINILSYKEKALLHKQYKFSILRAIAEIEVELAKTEEQRKPAIEFITSISEKMISLSNGNSPSFSVGADMFMDKEIKRNPNFCTQEKFKLQSIEVKSSPPTPPQTTPTPSPVSPRTVIRLNEILHDEYNPREMQRVDLSVHC